MKILIGYGSCGIAAGAEKIAARLKSLLSKAGTEGFGDIQIEPTGCIGMCYLEPIVVVINDSGSKTTYVKADDKCVLEIIKSLTGRENCVNDYAISNEDLDILHKQKRIALRNCGIINPEKINDYITTGGYNGFKSALKRTPAAIIDEIKSSGLAGRGGAGFPTWFKWQAARNSVADKKYIICNADEGDPGAFMDRAVIEGDPHCLIEGMLIAAYAIGAENGVVYVRAEYPLAIKRLEAAISKAADAGYLGVNILDSGFSFNLSIKAGAGAFVCGEETALISSLEGKRGMPKLKPPFPAQKGLWGKPTNINNVETYANVPWIILNGGAEFAKMGTPDSKGTKVFALTGKIKNGGLVEIPMGYTIRDVIFGVGGGIKDGRSFKAVQMGGPSGGCIPGSLIDTVIDYKTLTATGAIMGSGGMVVMDETTCMVDMARFFLDFTCRESCGKCVPCRIGTKRMLEILTRITQGNGRDGDIELLSGLANHIKAGSLCGLGQTAPNPVLTTIKYFRNEYEDHILKKKCTAKSCRALLRYGIDAEKCTGCTLCARKCPVAAITGELKRTHTLDTEKCIKCGKCLQTCRFDAVYTE